MTDRELDALMAEKVMGEHVHEWHATENWNNDVDAILEDTPLWLCSKCGAEFCGLLPSALSHHYSTSIADAWQVVERMQEMACTLSITSFRADKIRWNACFDNLSDAWDTEADTAPRAICLAALEAITKVEACGKRVGKASK